MVGEVFFEYLKCIMNEKSISLNKKFRFKVFNLLCSLLFVTEIQKINTVFNFFNQLQLHVNCLAARLSYIRNSFSGQKGECSYPLQIFSHN